MGCGNTDGGALGDVVIQFSGKVQSSVAARAGIPAKSGFKLACDTCIASDQRDLMKEIISRISPSCNRSPNAGMYDAPFPESFGKRPVRVI